MGSNPVPVVQETGASLGSTSCGSTSCGSTSGRFRAEQPSAAIAATVKRTGHIRRARSRHPVNSEVVGLTALGQSITFLPASRPSAGNVSRRHVAAAARTIYNVRRSETEQVASNMRADADPEQGRRTGEGRHHQFSWDPRATPTARHRPPATERLPAATPRQRRSRRGVYVPPRLDCSGHSRLESNSGGILQGYRDDGYARKSRGVIGVTPPIFCNSRRPPPGPFPGPLEATGGPTPGCKAEPSRTASGREPRVVRREAIVEVTGQNALSSVSANR